MTSSFSKRERRKLWQISYSLLLNIIIQLICYTPWMHNLKAEMHKKGAYANKNNFVLTWVAG